MIKIDEARIDEIRREAIDAAANCSPFLTSGTLARSCLDVLDAFAAVADENEHLRKSCDEWAETSQRNYQRALAAERALEEIKAARVAPDGEGWACPLDKGCNKNCGSYGCGN